MQMPAAPSVEEITSPSEILQIAAVVDALIAENDHSTCLAFVNGMLSAYATAYTMISCSRDFMRWIVDPCGPVL